MRVFDRVQRAECESDLRLLRLLLLFVVFDIGQVQEWCRKLHCWLEGDRVSFHLRDASSAFSTRVLATAQHRVLPEQAVPRRANIDCFTLSLLFIDGHVPSLLAVLTRLLDERL